jgi:hypothetical protein
MDFLDDLFDGISELVSSVVSFVAPVPYDIYNLEHNRRQAGRQKDEQIDRVSREIAAARAQSIEQLQKQIKEQRIKLQQAKNRSNVERNDIIERREQLQKQIEEQRIKLRQARDRFNVSGSNEVISLSFQ